jgi:hypothetical protein
MNSSLAYATITLIHDTSKNLTLRILYTVLRTMNFDVSVDYCLELILIFRRSMTL